MMVVAISSAGLSVAELRELYPGERVAMIVNDDSTEADHAGADFVRRRTRLDVDEIAAVLGARYPSERMRFLFSGAPAHRVRAEKMPGGSLRIEAIALACGGRLREELEVAVELWRWYHPELPVYVLTDNDEHLEDRYKNDDGVRWEVLSLEELEELGRTAATDHGGRWSRMWIGAKLEAWRRAINLFGLRGVLLADSDLVLTRRLPQMEWDADLVLSTHAGPTESRVPAFHGRYNAGMALARDSRVANRWTEMYREGRGTFYEQQCLEDLSREYVTDYFPESWNWGAWRSTEDLQESGRRPALLHSHIVGGLAAAKTSPSGESVRALARDSVGRVRRYRGTPDRVAFIHFPKAAGTSAMNVMHQVGEVANYQVLDSWGYGLRRDWSHDELRMMGTGELWGQVGDRWIVHNHAMNWPDYIVEMYAELGWDLVALYRPIRERLLSLYGWSRRMLEDTGRTPLASAPGRAESIEEFLLATLEDKVVEREWIKPVWIDRIGRWYRADSEGLQRMAVEMFCADEVRVRRLNRSRSAPWEDVDAGVRARVDGDARIQAWDTWADEMGF